MLFGVATADHQCEGYEPRWEDVRDRWEREMKLVGRGAATDFWHRCAEDVELARGLGCTAFRFSVAWARVEPSPGVFDAAALDHYAALTEAIVAAGMEPVLTLHHYTWPLHVEDRGGMTAAEFPERFAAYTARVVRRLSGRVRWWITFNEPDQLVYGYLKPWFRGEYRMPPGLPAGAGSAEQMRCVRLLMRNLFLANARARAVIREAVPGAMVSANPFVLGLPPLVQRFLDWRTTRLRTEDAWDRSGRRLARRALGGRGAVDVVAAAVTVTAGRGRSVDFSRPYRSSALRLLVPAGGPVRERADTRGRAIAVVRGSSAEAAFAETLPGAVPRPVADHEEALAELDSGRAAAVLGDDLVLAALVERSDGRYALGVEALRHQRHAVAVTSGQRDLLQLVDDVVDGRPTDSALDGPALRRIRSRGRLVAGVADDLPDIAWRDPVTGEWSGAEVDLVRAIASRILGDGARVTFVPLDTRDRIRALRPWNALLNPLMRWVDLLFAAVNGNWWHLGMAGRLPDWLCPEACAGQQDFVGLDYYWGIRAVWPARLHQLAQAAMGDFADAPVWPGGLGAALRGAERLFGRQPIMIVENGCVHAASGVSRARYLAQHLAELRRAVDRGCPVVGYLCWSVTSNREWGLPFGPATDFGLYHVDLDGDPDLRRVPTEAAAAYREMITSAGP